MELVAEVEGEVKVIVPERVLDAGKECGHLIGPGRRPRRRGCGQHLGHPFGDGTGCGEGDLRLFLDDRHDNPSSPRRCATNRRRGYQAIPDEAAESAEAAQTIGLFGTGDQPPPSRQRFQLPRPRRGPRHRRGHHGADPRACDPARMARRLDLQRSAGPHPGDRPRRSRAQAVPLPRALAAAGGAAQVRLDAGVRRDAAEAAPRGEEGPGARRDAARAGAGLRRSDCSTSASSGSEERSTPRKTRATGWRRSCASTSR